MPQHNSINSQTRARSAEQGRSSLSEGRAAREILLLLATASLSPDRKKRISRLLAGKVNWRYLLDLAEFHNIAPFISYNLTANGLASQVPKPYIERMCQTYNATLFRNVILAHELVRVLTVFSQRRIGVITLKGTVLADQLYGNLGLRAIADIDILVKPEELAQAGSLLMEIGYKKLTAQQEQCHPFHEVYSRQTQFPLFIELHWNLDDEKLVSVPGQIIWHRAQHLQMQEGSTMVLSLEDNFLFLSNHLIKHDDQLLRSLCDIAELLKRYSTALDWDYIIKSARSWGIEIGAYYSLKQAKELLGAPVPVSTLRALKPKLWRRWVLNFLVSRETFMSPIKWDKLRSETLVLVRSLMMKCANRTALVLANFRGRGKKGVWLKAIFWIVLVFGAALIRNMAGVVSGWRSSKAESIS
jgi:hypothetical protein